MIIDTKYRFMAVNRSTKDVYTQEDGFFIPACSYGALPMLRGYTAQCLALGCGKDHIQSIERLIEMVGLFQRGMIPTDMLLIDRKYRVLSVSVATGNISDDKSGFFFSAADKAVLAALQEIKADRDRKWPVHAWAGDIESLMERVELFQLKQRSKIPDSEPFETGRCASGCK